MPDNFEKFNKVHQKEFEALDSLGSHYPAKEYYELLLLKQHYGVPLTKAQKEFFSTTKSVINAPV